MSTFVNVTEAKTHLSRLLKQVATGEEVVIGSAGKPVAKLVPYLAASEPRRRGPWRGQVRIADDFEELPKEISAALREP